MTIFHEPWWLDTVTEAGWREVRVEQNGACVGRWPYVERKGPGRLVRVTSPPLCPRLGPLINPIIDSNEDLGAWSQVLGDLADQLPPHHHLVQSFDSQIQYWIPLAWRDFTQTTLFSFVDRGDGRSRRGQARILPGHPAELPPGAQGLGPGGAQSRFGRSTKRSRSRCARPVSGSGIPLVDAGPSGEGGLRAGSRSPCLRPRG